MASHDLEIILLLSRYRNMRVRSRVARTSTRVKDEQHSNFAVDSHTGEPCRDGAWQEEVETGVQNKWGKSSFAWLRGRMW